MANPPFATLNHFDGDLGIPERVRYSAGWYKALLIRIGYSSPGFFDALLAAHPAKHLADKVANVNRAFDILSQSRAAFVDLAGKFHSRVVYDLFESSDQDNALNEATKEVYTYSCAASSLVQAYRHMVSGNEEFKRRYDALRNEVFGNLDILHFFKDLRNNNNHIHILTASPHYTVTNRFEGKPEVKSGISFNRDAILARGEWSNKTKSFVSGRTDLEVIDLIDEHFKLALRFKSIVLFRTGIHVDRGYRDYAKTLRAREGVGTQVSLNILLQIADSSKMNPYEHLHRWFTADELNNIYCLTDHTKEQLEYMIALRDPLGLCNSSTRRQLYEVFSIPMELLPEQSDEAPSVDF